MTCHRLAGQVRATDCNGAALPAVPWLPRVDGYTHAVLTVSRHGTWLLSAPACPRNPRSCDVSGSVFRSLGNVLRTAVSPLAQGSLALRRSEKWADQPPGVLASTVAEMDFELADPVLAVLRAALDRHDLGYTPSRTPGLAAAFAGFAGRRMGWTVDPEQVVPVTDVMIGVASLCRALTEPGDAIALATPNYPPFLTELPREGLQLREVGLKPDGALDLDALERTLADGARVLVLTSPHNPTGRVLPRSELEDIAEICADHDAWVIADEIHAPLALAGATFTPWLEVSDAARESRRR